MTDFEKAGSVGFMIFMVVVLIATFAVSFWAVDGFLLAVGGYQ